MVHGEIVCSHHLLAEVAEPLLGLSFPPGRLSQLFPALALNLDMPLNGVIFT